MIADPNDDNVFWRCGSIFNGAVAVMCVSKSTDCGATWILSELTDTYGTTNTLALDPQNLNIIYAGGYDGVFKTTDGGNIWTHMSDSLLDVVDIEVHPVDTDIILAVTRQGVFKSTDAGGTWLHIGSSLVNAVVIDQLQPDHVYIATDSGAFQGTLDGGWVRMDQGLNDSSITTIAINPDYYLFCGTATSALFRWDLSTDIQEHGTASLSAIRVFPTPGTRGTSINYRLDHGSTVVVAVYDIPGRLIRTLYAGSQPAGMHRIIWNGCDMRGKTVPSGVYMCRLTTEKETVVQKLILVH